MEEFESIYSRSGVTLGNDIDEEFGKIAIDYEGSTQDGEVIVLSKKNIYRIQKEPPR